MDQFRKGRMALDNHALIQGNPQLLAHFLYSGRLVLAPAVGQQDERDATVL